MNHRPLSALLALSCITASVSVNAETVFRPRATLGFTAYELAFTNTATALSQVVYLKGGFGATIASGQVYFDLGYSSSLGATYDDGIAIGEDFQRTDTTITLGYAVSSNFTLFGGYKSGTTEYNNLFSVDTVTVFEATGPYFGMGVALPSESGTLSFNAAVAFLSATLTDNDPVFIQYDAEADAFGFSLGMAYSLPTSDSSGFALKGGFQSYNYVDWVDANYIIDDTRELIFSVDADFYVNF